MSFPSIPFIPSIPSIPLTQVSPQPPIPELAPLALPEPDPLLPELGPLLALVPAVDALAQEAREHEISKNLAALSNDPALLAASTRTFCDDQRLPIDQERMLVRRQEVIQASKENRERMQQLKALLPATKTTAPASDALKSAIQTQATSLVTAINALEDGQAVLIAGSYGEKRSLTQELFKLGNLLLGKNPQALPPLLREAFQKGAPTAETILQGLFSIVQEKGNGWETDPAVLRILDLILTQAQHADNETRDRARIELIASIHHIKTLPPEDQVKVFLQGHPDVISPLRRDALLEALVPTENNALQSIMELVLPPALVTHLSNAEHPAQTAEEIIKPFLKEIYDHVSCQLLSTNQKTSVKRAIQTFLDKSKTSKAIRCANFFSKQAFPVDGLAERFAILKLKEAQSPEALLDELGKIALEIAGERQTDFSHFLKLHIDENLEILFKDLLTQLQLPTDVRQLLQDSLLSKTGDYLIKCIRHSNRNYPPGNRDFDSYDIEVYLSGPLLSDPAFQQNWPIRFNGLNKRVLSHSFFRGLLQHTLALKETSPFSSSQDQFKQLLFAALRRPTVDQEDNASLNDRLPNSHLSATEMTFHYISCNPQTRVPQRENPAVKRLLWQYKKLQQLIRDHMHNDTLHFATLDRAKAIESAAARLLATAEGMKDQFPKILEKIDTIQATYRMVKEATQATKQREAQDLLAGDVNALNAPVAIHIPDAIKVHLAPHYAKLKKTIDSAERFFSYLPFSTSWLHASRKVLLQKIFHISPADALHVYALANTQFPSLIVTPANAPSPAERGLLKKTFNATLTAIYTVIKGVIKGIQWTLNALHTILRTCLSLLFYPLPTALTNKMHSLSTQGSNWVATATQAIQECLVEFIAKQLIQYYLPDQADLDTLSAFGKGFVQSMHMHLPLSFDVPPGMPDGEHLATEFASQLSPLSGFASLNHIQVLVTNGEITRLTIDTAGAFNLEKSNGISYFVHETHGTLCLQQYHSKLSAFRPFLLVEDPDGGQQALLRQVLVSDQIVDCLAEKQLGTFLWNGAKHALPQSPKENVLYTCQLADRQTHLTSSDPQGLLYIMRSYLIHEEDEAALCVYNDFERLMHNHPDLLPTDLTTHLCSLALCPSKLAVKIRLSLFAMLEQQRARNPAAAMWNNHPLHGFLWILLCADLHAVQQAPVLFPYDREHTPHLVTAMIERMHEHLPFYTTQEMAQAMKQVFHLEGAVSEESIGSFIATAGPMLDNFPAYIKNKAIQSLLPPHAQEAQMQVKESHPFFQYFNFRLVKEVAKGVVPELAYLEKGMSSLFEEAIVPSLSPKQIPLFIAEILQHVPFSQQEQTALRNLFAVANSQIEALASEDPIDLSNVPPLSAATLKSDFWYYYKICYDDSQFLTEASKPLRLSLALMQQELAHDVEAAILARILSALPFLPEERKERVFSPTALQQTLREEGIDVFLSRLGELLKGPTAILPGMNAIKKARQQFLVYGTKTLASATWTARWTARQGQGIVREVHEKKDQFVQSACQGAEQLRHGLYHGVNSELRQIKEGVQHKLQQASQLKQGIQQNIAAKAATVTDFSRAFRQAPISTLQNAAVRAALFAFKIPRLLPSLRVTQVAPLATITQAIEVTHENGTPKELEEKKYPVVTEVD